MTAQPRPSAVTMACVFVGLSCLLLLVNSLSWLTSWTSLEIQEPLREAVTGQGLRDTGLSPDEAIEWLRRGLMVVVVVLIAGVVFAVYAALGHQTSRVFLTLMCGVASVLFVAIGGLIGLLPAAFAISCAFQLWGPDARQWFAVKNGKQPAVAVPLAGTSPALPAQPRDAGTQAPAGSDQPAQTVLTASAAMQAASPRPRSVLAAGLVTIISAGLVVGVGTLFLLTYFVSYDEMIRAQQTSPFRDMIAMTDVELVAAFDQAAVACAVIVPLSLLASAAATAMLMGKSYGRIATLVLAVVTAPFALITVVGVPWTAAAIAVVILLRRPEAKAWFVRT